MGIKGQAAWNKAVVDDSRLHQLYVRERKPAVEVAEILGINKH